MSELNNRQWNMMHKRKRHQPVYPAESVIRFVSGIRKEDDDPTRILDAGCGAGRHVIMISNLGCIPYGVDYSQSGIEHTIKLLIDSGYSQYSSNIKKASVDDIPFSNDYFDGLICYGVLVYLVPEQIKKSISEFFRVLKPGGSIMLQIRTIEDYRYRSDIAGVRGDKHGLIVKEEDPDKSSSEENGMFMHFFTRSEVCSLMRDFTCLNICTEKTFHDNDAYADVNYVVIAKKP